MLYEGLLCEKMKWALISDWTVDEGLPNTLKILCTNKTAFDWRSQISSITYFTSSFITRDVASVKVTECSILLWTHSAASQQREGYLMYGATLIKCAEYLLTLQWRLLWSTAEAAVSHTVGADVPCCSKDTLQKQCWSSACWRGALAATEGKGQKKKKTTSSNHYLGSAVSVSSDNNPCFNAHLLLHTLKGIFKIIWYFEAF